MATNSSRSKENGQCIVRVEGIDKTITTDYLLMYFENKKRSGGGSITTSDDHRSEGYVLLTFEEEKDATEVLTRTHTLNGFVLKVTPSIATVQSPRNVKVTGFKPTVTEDKLRFYFESARGGLAKVERVALNSSKGEALVTFVDATAASVAVSRTHILDGCKLTLCIEGPTETMDDRILLRGLPCLNSSGDLKKFVEHVTSEQVLSVLFGEDNSLAVVIFSTIIDFQKIKAAFMQKSIMTEQVPLSKTVLVRFQTNHRPSSDSLVLYFENARRSGGGDVDDAVIGKSGEYALITFSEAEVARSVTTRQHTYEGHVLDVTIYMDCLGVLGGYNEPHSKTVDRVKDSLRVNSREMKLMEKCKTLERARQQHPDVAVTKNEDDGCVEFEGAGKKVHEIKTSLMSELQNVTSLNHTWDSPLVKELLAHPSARAAFEAHCLGRHSKCILEFTDRGFEVKSFDGADARDVLSKGRNAVAIHTIPLLADTENARKLPQWTELKDSIQDDSKGLILIRESSGSLTIMSVDEDLSSHVQTLESFLQDNSRQDDEVSFAMGVLGHLFFNFLRKYVASLDINFDRDSSNITVRGDKAGVQEAKNIKQKFDGGLIRHVRSFNEPCLQEYLGTKDWKHKGRALEERLECKILQAFECPREWRIDKTSADKYLAVGQKTKSNVDKAAREHFQNRPNQKSFADKAAMRRPESNKYGATEENFMSSTTIREFKPKPLLKEKYSMPLKPKITIKQTSDITREKVGALVNSSNPSLDLHQGQVSRALLDAGGEKIQELCNKKFPRGIKMGEIGTTGAGNLPCERLFHCCLPSERDDKAIVNIVSSIVTKCLARADKKKLTSVGFPALGTGNLCYPPDIVAEAMYQATRKYGLEHKKTKITDVIFFLHVKDEVVCKTFQAEDMNYNHPHRAEAEIPESQLIQASASLRTSQLIQTKPPIQEASRKTEHYTFFEDHRDDVVLVFVCLERRVVNEATQEMLTFYKESIKTLSIPIPLLHKWDDHNITLTKNACMPANIDITFDYSAGCLELKGLQENLSKIPIDPMIKTAETHLHDKHMAELISHQVQWYRLIIGDLGEELQEFDLESNLKIEIAYRNGKGSVAVVDPDTNVATCISFDKMEELPEDPTQKAEAVIVVRRDIIQETALDAPLPGTWKAMRDDLLIDKVPLQANSTEYRHTEKMYKANCARNMEVIRIERIQNITIYKQYMAMKKQIETSLPGKLQCERDLWHVTTEDDAERIIQNGFNRSFTNDLQKFYGEGVYLTVDGTPTHGQSKTEHKVFLCKVLTGEYTKGSSDMRRAPEIQSSQGRFYNSVVDDVANPSIFVVFHDASAYPQYLLTVRYR